MVVGTHEHDLFATSHGPDPCQVIQPRRVSPELYWLAKAFDECTPYREARAPASRAAAKGGSV